MSTIKNFVGINLIIAMGEFILANSLQEMKQPISHICVGCVFWEGASHNFIRMDG